MQATKSFILCTSAALTSSTAWAITLDNQLLSTLKRSILLAETAYDRPPIDVESIAPGALYFVDEPDAALLSHENNKCFVAFRATEPNAVDWLQNLDVRLTNACLNGSQDRCCQARRGFFEGYTRPSYRLELEEGISECMSSCEGGCELIITGTSQGAGIGAAAGLALADHNPFLVLFGQPPAIMEDCSHILPRERYIKVQNSMLFEGNEIRFDLVPNLPGSDLDRNGQTILTSEDPLNVKLYSEPAYGPLVSAVQIKFLTSFEAHRLPLYSARMNQLVIPEGAETVGLDGFSEGFGCYKDSECKTGKCLDNLCYDLLQGQPMDEAFLSVAVRAAHLSRSTFESNAQDRPDKATVLSDASSIAMVYREEEVCYGVFGGKELRKTDFLFGLDLDLVEYCNSDGDCCPVRAGFLDAYDQSAYVAELETELRNCLASCPSCQVVLTGFSEGAAIATVAAISLNDIGPAVLVFGAPPTMIGDCTDAINAPRTYRFINSAYEDDSFDVDPITNAIGSVNDRNGIFILLGHSEHVNVYAPDESSVTLVPELKSESHQIDGYIKRLEALRTSVSAGKTIEITGFPLGEGCNKHFECQTGLRCEEQQCSEPTETSSPTVTPSSMISSVPLTDQPTPRPTTSELTPQPATTKTAMATPTSITSSPTQWRTPDSTVSFPTASPAGEDPPSSSPSVKVPTLGPQETTSSPSVAPSSQTSGAAHPSNIGRSYMIMALSVSFGLVSFAL